MKNDLDVFYFSTMIPMHVLFTEDGQMDKRVFLQAWKDIPAQNEVQFTMSNMRGLSPGERILGEQSKDHFFGWERPILWR